MDAELLRVAGFMLSALGGSCYSSSGAGKPPKPSKPPLLIAAFLRCFRGPLDAPERGLPTLTTSFNPQAGTSPVLLLFDPTAENARIDLAVLARNLLNDRA